LLLRMFAKTGGHNRVTDYRQNHFPDNELSIHTWMDADLRELAELVKQTQSSARGRDAVMEFSLVYPDKRGMNVMKVVRVYLPSAGCTPNDSYCSSSIWYPFLGSGFEPAHLVLLHDLLSPEVFLQSRMLVSVAMMYWTQIRWAITRLSLAAILPVN
jgi:hypothetical protein